MGKTETVTAEQRARFLKELAKTRNTTVAAQAAGIPRRAALDLRARDEDFAAACVDAEEEATDMLEHAARTRAIDGIEEPISYHGKQTGTVRRYSETLLLLFLRAERPEKFAERAGAGKGAGKAAGQAAGGVLVVPGKLDPKTWRKQAKKYQRQLANGGGT